MTERWMAEKYLPSARFSYPRLPWHDAKLFFLPFIFLSALLFKPTQHYPVEEALQNLIFIHIFTSGQ